MKKYRVIKSFTDLQDNNYKYGVGDEYPRSDLTVSKKRLEELSTSKNRRGIPVLEVIDEPEVETAEEEITPEVPENGADEKPKRGRKKKNAD